MIKFMDKNGEILCMVSGRVDPNKFPRARTFPEGWTWKEIDAEEEGTLCPHPKGIYHEDLDTPHERIMRLKAEHEDLKKRHEATVELMEEKLGLQKGKFKEELALKLSKKD
jgi:hypothetical protein